MPTVWQHATIVKLLDSLKRRERDVFGNMYALSPHPEVHRDCVMCDLCLCAYVHVTLWTCIQCVSVRDSCVCVCALGRELDCTEAELELLVRDVWHYKRFVAP